MKCSNTVAVPLERRVRTGRMNRDVDDGFDTALDCRHQNGLNWPRVLG